MLLMKASLVERPTWAVLDFSQEWNFFPWEICSDFWKYRFFKQKKYERFRARHSIKENSPRHERGTKKDIPVPMKNGIRDYLNPLLLYDTSLSSDKLNHAEKKNTVDEELISCADGGLERFSMFNVSCGEN